MIIQIAPSTRHRAQDTVEALPRAESSRTSALGFTAPNPRQSGGQPSGWTKPDAA
jgi:hypothetical protein